MSAQIAADLERKFVNRLQELYDRECEIMRHVLDPAEISMILIRAVTGSILTTAATVAGMSRPDVDPVLVYDLTIARINERAAKNRAAASARAVQHHAALREAR